jgi:molybdenum cofactor biosynthesis enzyme MoaA
MDKGGGFMYEIADKGENLKSLSIFVGTGNCNANCQHCAGLPFRKDSPKQDGDINKELIYETVKKCYKLGARRLSISSSGEPTLSPISITKTLELIHDCEQEGIQFNPINLYSNGIRIGEDKAFTKTCLPLWKDLGLTTVYLTIHNINEKKNAKIYGVKNYPNLKLIISRIKNAKLAIRANLVLSKNTINTFKDFEITVKHLNSMGVENVSAWLIRDSEDKVDKNLSPDKKEIYKIKQWIKKNKVEDKIRLLVGKKSRQVYQKGEKLTLFPDGTLTNIWCNS